LASELTESLQRFRQMGLALAHSPVRMPAGSALIAQNCWRGPLGSVNSRPGYIRWLNLAMGQPVTMVTQLDNRVLVVAGDVEEQGSASC
jgi:hypothetical protein